MQIFFIHAISIGSHSRFFDDLKCKTKLDNCINNIDAFYDIGRHGNLAQGVHGLELLTGLRPAGKVFGYWM